MQRFRHRLSVALMSLAAGLCGSTALAAQSDFSTLSAEARQHRVLSRPPFAGLDEIHARNRRWSINSFYFIGTGPPSDRQRYYVIRRQTGGPAIPASLQWADSRTCPAVIAMLEGMETLPPVRPDVPGIGQEMGDIVLVADGIGHILWNRSVLHGENRALVSLEISGNVNSPVGLWWRSAAEALDACWTETPPE